ncbi:metalloregulator ArsR/SmtB family transcription factor [Acidithiobacillus sp. AMEEHan]|uniref:ArsR/SmtB family transcription factor n=1 Tax=Acidithiobacillus sp. AMEEHan TaxID=2994951 RepID=UPI0027E3C737|nr:metalloregulator ArsR/SmtB family transcription factor [Acidithiobacillus sp. AMEEHan]
MNESLQSSRIVAQLEALASPVRLKIFRLLVQQEPLGLFSGEIAEHLGQAHNGISFHLKTLQHAELVTVAQEGRHHRYRAQMPVVRALVAYLTENCCQGTQSCTVKGKDTPEQTSSPQRRSAP